MEDKKYLVAYFSHGGHAKSIAERVATFMGGDLFEIRSKEDYPRFFPFCVKKAIGEKRADARPETLGHVEDMEDYTDVVLGYPCWCGTCPQIILTFLEQ